MPKFTSLKSSGITANFSSVSVRNEKLNGKDYIVAPMVMMVEGVLEGSAGPLFYPQDEMKKTPEVWNMKPVVVYHPQKDGQGVSACSPEILEDSQVGMIMNTKFESGKLKAEAWLDPDKINLVDNRVNDAITNNRMMELSTGLFTDTKDEPGEWQNIHYDAIAINYRPDHLALLPDQKGACSIEDGAGLMRLNSKGNQCTLNLKELEKEQKEYILSNENKVLDRMGLKLASLIENEMSFSSVRSALISMLRADSNDDSLWIEEVYSDFFIYEKDGKLFKQNYSKQTNNGPVEIKGNPIEVVRVTEFRTINGEFVGNRKDTLTMNKEQRVTALIVNKATHWEEKDREFLMNQEEDTLEKMEPVETEPEKEAETKEAVETETVEEEPVTANEYINAAPVEIREVLRNSMALHAQQKKTIIQSILANKKCKFTENQLQEKQIDELQMIAELAANKEDDKKPSFLPQIDFVDNAGQGELKVLSRPNVFADVKSE